VAKNLTRRRLSSIRPRLQIVRNGIWRASRVERKSTDWFIGSATLALAVKEIDDPLIALDRYGERLDWLH